MQHIKAMKKRAWVLLGILTVGFSLIWLLPKQKDMVLSRLSKELPEVLAGWKSEKMRVSEEEKKVLADDTEFSRRSYYNPSLKGFPGIEVSVVFSGKDINNSLHRPEVCLHAQGWNFVRERTIIVPNIFADGSGIPVREIVCVRPRVGQGDQEPPKNKDGEPIYDKLIQYYTFFGSEKIVSGHYARTFADIKARLLGGYDQQWAYATFSTSVTSIYRDQGFDLPVDEVYDEEQSSEMMQQFMRELLPTVVKEEQK